VYKRFKVGGTPFLLFLDGDGNEVDWIYTYSAPPSKFHEKVLKIFKGEDTFRALSGKLQSSPQDVPLLMQVARKHESRFERDKALPLYKEILTLDPEGRAGTTDNGGIAVPCVEYADFRIALDAGNKAQDPAPFLAFAARRPASPLAREAYRSCSFMFLSGRSKDEAFQFFEDALAKYPGDPLLTFYYLQRIARDNDNLDRGIALAREMAGTASLNDMAQRMGAQLQVLKGDIDSAEAAYGPDYIDGRLSSAVSALQNYAQFWAGQKRNMEDALRAMKLAMDLQPDSIYAANSAAGFYIRAGLPEKADEVYGPAYAEKYKDDAQALALYAAFWARQKKHPESLSAAEAAIRLKPDDPNILQMTAQTFLAWDKKDRMLAVYGPSAVAKIGDDAMGLNSYAWFWAQQGTNLESALAAARRSIELDDRDWTEDTLAVVLLGLGRLDEALAAVNKAMAMSSTPSRYKETEKKIKDAIEKNKPGK
jgi:tetratricopeptide (TPR) repeat protein